MGSQVNVYLSIDVIATISVAKKKKKFIHMCARLQNILDEMFGFW